VALPAGRLADTLYAEQTERFINDRASAPVGS
jgi:hypothetical protein